MIECFLATQQTLFYLIILYLCKITTCFDLYRPSSDKLLILKLATVSITILNFVRCGFLVFFVVRDVQNIHGVLHQP
jgi:large-conductance mechanosensitive channel